MNTPDSGLVLLGGRLVIRSVDQPDSVSLQDFDGLEHSDKRLLIVVDTGQIEAVGHYCFHSALGHRGHLALVDAADVEVLVSNMVSGVDDAGRWLNNADLSVTVVAVEPVPLALVAAAVLVASGLQIQESMDAVDAVLPSAFCDRDLDLGLSVFRDNLEKFRRRWAREREVSP